VVSKPRIPQAGDLIKINFDPQAAHEQAGWRRETRRVAPEDVLKVVRSYIALLIGGK
jgi:hypothetical protein